jgi:hypothetical protein
VDVAIRIDADETGVGTIDEAVHCIRAVLMEEAIVRARFLPKKLVQFSYWNLVTPWRVWKQ